MSVNVISLKCPNCNAGVDTGQKVCIYCKSPVIISTFNSIFDLPASKLNQYAGAYKQALAENPADGDLNSSVGMCYLRLKLYDKASEALNRAMDSFIGNSETYFYAAVCLLRGQKPFLAKRAVIDAAVEYINAAIALEPRGIYYYFLAYIKYDYFKRKMLNTSPEWQEAMALSEGAGIPPSPDDINKLFVILGVENPF